MEEVRLRYCTVVFEYHKEPQETINITIKREGKPTVIFEKEDFNEILNALISSKQVINSTDTVRFNQYNVNPCFYKPSDIEIFVLTTKINHEIKISIMGFEHYTTSLPQKVYKIYIDKEDDIFKLCGEYLRFVSTKCGDYRGRVFVE